MHYTANGGDTPDFTVPLRRIFYEILDIILVGIDLRFTSVTMDTIAACDMVTNKREYSGNDFSDRLGINITECESKYFKHFSTEKLDKDATLLDILNVCDKEMFPNVYDLLLSLVVCPISSVCVECFFSTVNRVMIPSRKNMTSQRLNHLCILSFNRDLTKHIEANVNLVKIQYHKLHKSS